MNLFHSIMSCYIFCITEQYREYVFYFCFTLKKTILMSKKLHFFCFTVKKINVDEQKVAFRRVIDQEFFFLYFCVI